MMHALHTPPFGPASSPLGTDSIPARVLRFITDAFLISLQADTTCAYTPRYSDHARPEVPSDARTGPVDTNLSTMITG